ncbi:sulfatase-like hydrolase/transferase, partial [Helicobacter sp. MIT 14-3879]|uniref:sulfatase-like hydrolase/transferase n=1 Tax=Helicobacter sp. MIT 14-3879 TaxID=2040649 RepID=UPI000E38331C
DTHFPNGYVDKDFCSDLEFGYSSAIKCSDRIISDFIAWVKKQDFYKNTTIIILGDHLSMQQNFFPDNAKRAIFNVFINPKFSKEASKELIKNRLISHFDITPLILDSIGFKVESFGLGRNPLYKKTLLEEYEDFNDLIMQPSKTYESFWQEKSNKEK